MVGMLLDYIPCIPPEFVKLPGSLPRLTTSHVFNWEMWVMFEEAVSICCFRLAVH